MTDNQDIVRCAYCGESIDTCHDDYRHFRNHFFHWDCFSEHAKLIYLEEIDELIALNQEDFFLGWIKQGELLFSESEKKEIEIKAYREAYETCKSINRQVTSDCESEYWDSFTDDELIERLEA